MEKALVFIWSQITLYPLLTPVLVWPVLWTINKYLLKKPLERVNAALIFFVGIGLVVYATFVNFEQGPDLYAAFLEKRGVQAEALVDRVERVTAIPQFEKTDEVVMQLRTLNGPMVTISHQTEVRRFYPMVDGVIPPPKVGDKILIRYFPKLENGFIVLTDSDKSEYGSRLNCIRIKQKFDKIEKQYKFVEYVDAALVAKFRDVIEERIRASCVTLDERDALRATLEKLIPGSRH